MNEIINFLINYSPKKSPPTPHSRLTTTKEKRELP